MPYPVLELEDRLNWDLALKGTFQAPLPEGIEPGATLKAPIATVTAEVQQPILAIGCKCPHARPNWSFGGTASLILQLSPSATSSYAAQMYFGRVPLRLNNLCLAIFPRFSQTPYKVGITFPNYFYKAELEIWQYSGIDTDSVNLMLENYQEVLARIEQKIDFIGN